MRLIVNADDLGASPAVNAAIFGLMAAGRVTSATIMANAPAFAEAVSRAVEFPRRSFGLHLNATQFAPLASSPDLKPLLDAAGNFSENAIRRVKITGPLRAALLREWAAQVQRLLDAGVRVSHLDSHHHVHTIPGLFPVLKELQQKFQIKKIRLSWNVYSPAAPATRLRRLAKSTWNFALKNFHATTVTDGFTSLETFLQAARALPPAMRTVEVMVHPGGGKYEDETRMLAGEWWRTLPFPVEFISYHQL